jgi:hypothetical protein
MSTYLPYQIFSLYETFNFKIEEIKREERRREKVDARQKAAGQHIMVTTRIEQRHGSLNLHVRWNYCKDFCELIFFMSDAVKEAQ